MGSLSFQTQVAGEVARSMVRATWPRAYKVLQDGVDRGLLEEMVAHGLELVVGRYVFPESGNPDEVGARCTKLLAWADENLRWLKDRGVRVVLEVPYNEELQNGEALDRLNALTLKAIPLLAARGYDVGIGVFSEGNPSGNAADPFVDWPRFHPALRAARASWLRPGPRVFLCLHEYGVPSLGVVDTWHNFRYRRVWERLPTECRVPILITESGIDGGIEGKRAVGYRGYMDAKHYADWLWTTRTELNKDDYVWYSFVFGCGMGNDWGLFDVRDEVDLRPPLIRGLPARQWQPTQEETVFNIDDVRNQLWAIAETLEKNGHPWFGQLIKAGVALSKAER